MKKLLLFLVFLCQVLAAHAQLSTSVNFTGLCQGSVSAGQVFYTSSTTTYLPGNVFTAQISDAAGSFASPLAIGTITSTANSGTVWVTIPGTLPVGTGYRVRVVASNPAVVGADNGTDIPVVSPPSTNVTSNSPLCAGSTLQLSVTSSAPGATYSWQGPNNYTIIGATPSIPNAQPPNSGMYYAMVTTNGCTVTDSVMVVVSPQPPAPVLTSNAPVCEGQTLMLSASSSPGAMFTWTGPNGFNMFGNPVIIPNVTQAATGPYQVLAFLNGCASPTGLVQVNIEPMPQVTITPSSPVICAGQSVTLSAAGAGVVSYTWTPGAGSGPAITVSPTTTTTYTVYAMGNSGCVAMDTVQVTVQPGLVVQSNSPVQTAGTLVLSASTGQPGQLVQWTGPNGFTATGSTVYIQNVTPAHAGVYTATYNDPNCGPLIVSQNVLIGNVNTVTGTVYNDANNNGTFDSGELPMSNVVVQLQPGNYYGITDQAGNFQVAVLDGSYTLTAVAPNPQQVVNPASHAVSVSGGSQVSAGNNFGIYTPPTQDLMVFVSPGTVAIPGFAYQYTVFVSNIGATTVSGQARTVPASQLSTITTAVPATVSGDTLSWDFTNLAPGQSLSYQVNALVPVGTAFGSIIQLMAIAEPIATDVTPANNVATFSQVVVGSYDPNDKAVSPPGPISPAQVSAGQELVYKIRFQNTGTYLAFNVLVADTLSQHLDISTFRMLSASHNYNLSLRENGILEWHFPNIMLPDSTSDEPNSHGYIQYSIKPKATLQLGDEIENTAHIFFDFNEAIVTNTTSTVVAQPSGLQQVCPTAAQLQLYPNPTTGKVMVQLRDPGHGAVQLRVYTLMGNLAHQSAGMAFNGVFVQPLNLSHLPAGMYIVQVVKNGRTHTERLFLQ